MFEVAEEQFGSVDILCPGAGVFEPHWSNFWHPPGTSPASSDDPDGGRYAMLDINLTHPIRATQLAIAKFLNPKRGPKTNPANPKRVVHISSVAGQLPNFVAPIYVATKHGINGLVRSLAPLKMLGIRVNPVAPGLSKRRYGRTIQRSSNTSMRNTTTGLHLRRSQKPCCDCWRTRAWLVGQFWKLAMTRRGASKH